jgi:DNA-binding transcriptional LysR family regulator
MNLQQLRYLVAAADTGSLSGAARTEQVSQPVVSRALHSLEQECHLELFRRDGRRLVLTDAGNAMVIAARQALDAVDEVQRTARRLAGDSGLVIVATPSNSVLLSSIVAALLDRYPDIALRLRRAGDMDEVRELVAAGHGHLGFGDLAEPALPPHQALATTPIWQAEVVLISPATLQLPPAVPREQLGKLALALPPDGSKRRSTLETLITASGGSRPIAVLSAEESFSRTAAAQQGIASCFSYEVVGLQLDGVTVRSLDPPLTSPVGFVYCSEGLTREARLVLQVATTCQPPVGCVPIELVNGSDGRLPSPA